jgi:hypothetical protein
MVTQIFATPGNVTSFVQQLAYINSLTDVGAGGMLGIGLLILIGGVLLLMMKSFTFERSFSVAALVTAILSALLRIMGLINDTTLTICIVLGVFGLILLFKEEN